MIKKTCKDNQENSQQKQDQEEGFFSPTVKIIELPGPVP